MFFLPDIKSCSGREVPRDLFLLADPDPDVLDRYLDRSQCFAALDGDEIIGGILTEKISKRTAEIKNVVVRPDYQRRGVGRSLVDAALLGCEEDGLQRVLIRTGTTGVGQLALYQQCGFRIEAIERDYFPRHYPEIPFDDGMLLLDQAVLAQRLYSAEEKKLACQGYWEAFIHKNSAFQGRSWSQWCFGYGYGIPNSLIGLVKCGQKKATTSALEMYEKNEKRPEVGDLSVITYGNGLPGCIIETTAVTEKPYSDVTAEEAAREGEGDGSLEYWRDAHRWFFTLEYKKAARTFHPGIPVLLEDFRVVFNQ